MNSEKPLIARRATSLLEKLDADDNLPRRSLSPVSRWLRRTGRWLLRSGGWTIVGQVPSTARGVAIGAPHTSNIDGIVAASAMLALGIDLRVMMKSSMFVGPFGRLLRWIGFLPINRSAATDVTTQCVQQLNSKPMWLGVAPEGTRKNASCWKSGFHRIAREANVPIIPIALDYGRRELRFGTAFYPSDSYAVDLARVQEFMAKAKPRHRRRLSLPLKQLQANRQN